MDTICGAHLLSLRPVASLEVTGHFLVGSAVSSLISLLSLDSRSVGHAGLTRAMIYIQGQMLGTSEVESVSSRLLQHM